MTMHCCRMRTSRIQVTPTTNNVKKVTTPCEVDDEGVVEVNDEGDGEVEVNDEGDNSVRDGGQ